MEYFDRMRIKERNISENRLLLYEEIHEKAALKITKYFGEIGRLEILKKVEYYYEVSRQLKKLLRT